MTTPQPYQTPGIGDGPSGQLTPVRPGRGLIITGIVFGTLLFATDQWRRIVPTSPVVLGQAWNTWVHYVTFHLPPEPNGFYGYNALQQIAYGCGGRPYRTAERLEKAPAARR